MTLVDMGEEPGELHLCLQSGPSEPCSSQLLTEEKDPDSLPHYLKKAQIVEGAFGRPMLLVQTTSTHSFDGDQLVVTQVLEYRSEPNQFVRVYKHNAGWNNNQEDRYIQAGVLKGDVISVKPTDDAPFGYWVSVNAPTPNAAYKKVLRYRSATTYGDHNPLPVIDSEMPNIQRHLGLWKLGSPLPLPADPCPNPHLVRTELWCN